MGDGGKGGQCKDFYTRDKEGNSKVIRTKKG